MNGKEMAGKDYSLAIAGLEGRELAYVYARAVRRRLTDCLPCLPTEGYPSAAPCRPGC
jgi:hypothetical protein